MPHSRPEALEDCLEQSEERQVRDGAQHPDPMNRATWPRPADCAQRSTTEDLSSAHDTDTLASRQLACSEPSILSHQQVRRVSRGGKAPRPFGQPRPSPIVRSDTIERIRAAVNNPAPYCGVHQPGRIPQPPRCSDASSPARARRRQRGAAAGRRCLGAGGGSGPEGMGMASGDAHGPDGGLTPGRDASSRHPRARVVPRSPDLGARRKAGWYPSGGDGPLPAHPSDRAVR